MVSARQSNPFQSERVRVPSVNNSGTGGDAELVEVTIKAWLNRDVEVVVKVPVSGTCKDAMELSGLMARDGSPCHCLNQNGRIIDNKLALKFPMFQIGVPPTLEPVWIEGVEKMSGGLPVGVGFLQDGTKAFVPGVGVSDFVWVYRCREWVTDGEHRCNATRVRVEENSNLFEVGDLIFVTPEVGDTIHPVYNSSSGLLNRSMRIDLPRGVGHNRFGGEDWAVKIMSISPLQGVFLPNGTHWPENTPESVRNSGVSTGEVQWYDWRKKFGFIKREKGGKIFFHVSQVSGRVKKGDAVEFRIGEGSKGPTAMNVKKIK